MRFEAPGSWNSSHECGALSERQTRNLMYRSKNLMSKCGVVAHWVQWMVAAYMHLGIRIHGVPTSCEYRFDRYHTMIIKNLPSARITR